MARALKLAERGRYTTMPNPRVGCVLVKHGKHLADGYHQRAGEPHAEVHALEAAGEHARGATAYVTLEPCMMCSGAIIHARIRRLVYGAAEPRSGMVESRANLFAQPWHFHQVEVEGGVLASRASRLLKTFFAERR